MKPVLLGVLVGLVGYLVYRTVGWSVAPHVSRRWLRERDQHDMVGQFIGVNWKWPVQKDR